MSKYNICKNEENLELSQRVGIRFYVRIVPITNKSNAIHSSYTTRVAGFKGLLVTVSFRSE